MLDSKPFVGSHSRSRLTKVLSSSNMVSSVIIEVMDMSDNRSDKGHRGQEWKVFISQCGNGTSKSYS